MQHEFDAIIVGGGFFGCSLALHLRRTAGLRVVVLEAGPGLMRRASYVNQARVHNGYHYPRSVLTGLRSRVNFPRFVEDYHDCIVDDVDAYYAVARLFSNVSATQFEIFCERIGAPCRPAPAPIRGLFNPNLIEQVYRVTEYAFDSVRLRGAVREALGEAGVEIRFETEAKGVRPLDGGGSAVSCTGGGSHFDLTGGRVYNCTYSRINKLLYESGIPIIPVKQELAEIALIRIPDELNNFSVTIMCGPFFSIMPFPPRGLRSLYHVRYALHDTWYDHPSAEYRDPHEVLKSAPRISHQLHMMKDAARYIPALERAEYAESLWEVRTVLPLSEGDDSRPILYVEHEGIDLTTIVGGKIDNFFDMIEFETTRSKPAER